MSCLLHQVGFQITEQIYQALTSPEWDEATRGQPVIRNETNYLLNRVQVSRDQLYAAQLGVVTKEHERYLQALREASDSLDKAFLDLHDVQKILKICEASIQLIAKIISEMQLRPELGA